MKALLVILLGSLVSLNSPAEIRETLKMSEALSSVDKDTLLIFDIDNTLIEPIGQEGSDQWYYYLEAKYRKQGLTEEKVYEKSMREWNRLQDTIKVKTPEPEIANLIKAAQKRGIQTMGLTARTLDVAPRTIQQIKEVSISFENPAIYPKDLEIKDKDLAKYTHGILFVGERNEKGQLLVKFLEQLQLKPKRIVFVDDKVKNVNSVETALAIKKIPVVNFRYGAADEKVKRFTADLEKSRD